MDTASSSNLGYPSEADSDPQARPTARDGGCRTSMLKSVWWHSIRSIKALWFHKSPWSLLSGGGESPSKGFRSVKECLTPPSRRMPTIRRREKPVFTREIVQLRSKCSLMVLDRFPILCGLATDPVRTHCDPQSHALGKGSRRESRVVSLAL